MYPGAHRKTDKYEKWDKQSGSPGATFSTSDHDLHRRRRAALNPFFAKRSVVQLETRISDKVTKLCDRLWEEWQKDRVVDLHVPLTALTTDIITYFCYGYSYDYLNHDDFNKEWEVTMRKMFDTVALRRHFPWLLSLVSLPFQFINKEPPIMKHFITAKEGIKKEVGRIIKVEPGTKSKEKESIFTTLRDSDDLPTEEKSVERMTDEAFILIAAGTETTAKTLTETMFHILNTPGVLQKLTEELDAEITSRDDVPTWTRLEKLPYLVISFDKLNKSLFTDSNRAQSSPRA